MSCTAVVAAMSQPVADLAGHCSFLTPNPDIEADYTLQEITDSYLRMDEWLVRVGLDDDHEARTAIGFLRVEVPNRIE